ncbi:unnamed protein product [Effrenium voratum]|uniref:Uncharacterized protein n=1 Tax=Effrenium voratum TaxID=2562239 RepID=A0AA36J8K4_9DINO|nr:unnamed protein product [Effrenium voratum]
MRLWLLPLLAAASGALEEVPEVPEVPEAPEPPEPEERAANYSLSVESCRRYVLEVSSHGPGFYQDANLHRYTRCLFVLRGALRKLLHADRMGFASSTGGKGLQENVVGGELL